MSFTEVAALIDPTTVTFTSLTDPATRVLEQNFQFDLVSTQKLLLKYIDQPITVGQAVGNSVTPVTGTLLSRSTASCCAATTAPSTHCRLFGACASPICRADSTRARRWCGTSQRRAAARSKTRVTYQTGGITWWADYNLVFNEGADANSGMLDLSRLGEHHQPVGRGVRDAQLKLIAGDVHRVAASRCDADGEAALMEMARASAPMRLVSQQKDFFEFHLYTLGRRTTLPNNSTKQIELFDQAKQIPGEEDADVLRRAAVLLRIGTPYADREHGRAG